MSLGLRLDQLSVELHFLGLSLVFSFPSDFSAASAATLASMYSRSSLLACAFEADGLAQRLVGIVLVVAVTEFLRLIHSPVAHRAIRIDANALFESAADS